MINLILNGSQQNGIEEELIKPIVERTAEIINAEGLLVVTLLPLYSGVDEYALYQSIEASNDLSMHAPIEFRHLAIHADADYTGTGASGLYFSEEGRKFIAPIYEAISAVTPWNDMGLVHRTDLGELKNTYAVAGIIELSFYDNPEELTWMQNNVDTIAHALKKGVYTSLGIVEAIDWQAKFNAQTEYFYKLKRDVMIAQLEIAKTIDTILNTLLDKYL